MEGCTRRTCLTAGSAALVGLGISRPAWSQGPQPLFIRGARVIDPDIDGPSDASNLIVGGGRILAVGPSIQPPSGAQIADATGKFLLPGLWDMHAHLAALNEVGAKPEAYVGHGVLGVRDMGGHVGKLLAYQAELSRGRIGPQLVFAGPTLNGQRFADFHRLVTTEAEARSAIRQLKTLGVHLIKIHRALKPAILPAVIDEARKACLPVAGHVPLGMGWAEASDAGMHMEHLVVILENEMALHQGKAPSIEAAIDRIEGRRGRAIFARMAANRTYLDPTLVHYETRLAKLKPDVVDKARALFVRIRALTGQIHRAGVPILAGTDELEQPGRQLIRELELLVEGGLTARESIRAATTTAALAAGRPEFAKIAGGAPASFLLLEADPTSSVGNLRRLSLVVLDGRLIDAPELARLRALDS